MQRVKSSDRPHTGSMQFVQRRYFLATIIIANGDRISREGLEVLICPYERESYSIDMHRCIMHKSKSKAQKLMLHEIQLFVTHSCLCSCMDILYASSAAKLLY